MLDYTKQSEYKGTIMGERIIRQQKDMRIETRILRAEQNLGIQTQSQRLLEARLFIDAPLFNTALIL